MSIDIIVVGRCSAAGDGSRRDLEGQGASVTFVPCDRAGRAACWNAGLRIAFARGARAVLLVQAGVTVPADCVARLIAVADAHGERAVAAAPLLAERRPSHVITAGYWYSEWRAGWEVLTCERRAVRGQSVLPVTADFPGSAAMLIPQAVYAEVGDFDERFADHLEDVDWCIRARNSGFPALLVADATAFAPAPNADTPKGADWTRARSTYLLARKHRIPRGLAGLAVRRLVGALTAEVGKVDFWATYAMRVGLTRRTLWYLRNALRASMRATVRDELRALAQCVLGRSPGASP
jgi:GT2 family glycosyltransferase